MLRDAYTLAAINFKKSKRQTNYYVDKRPPLNHRSDIKYSLQSHPRLDLLANSKSNIWIYYKSLKKQAFVLTDTFCNFNYAIGR